MEKRVCKVCKRNLNILNFKNLIMNGKRYFYWTCKKCYPDYFHNPKFRTKRRIYNQTPERKNKIKVWNKLTEAVKCGKVKKQPCKVCGRKKVQAHHPDYNKPLEVIWLCRKHHDEIHCKN